LSLDDFKAVGRMPGSVALGFVAQYTIMPLCGWLVATLLDLEPGLAVGIILVASCPGGMASNMITYLAKANVALSVVLTLASTSLAFFFTPMWTTLLAGQYVPVDAWALCLSALQLTVAPVVLGVLIRWKLPRMADAIGADLDRMTFDVTFAAATGDTDLGFMTIPEGTVAGVYGYHRGWVGDRNVVSVGFNWIMGNHVEPPKPLEHGHVIQVFGMPNMRTVLHCLPPKDWAEPGIMGLGMICTAMPVTNAVPAVVAAEPGIVTLADLPPITGRFAG
jgi:hypothetical protein